MKVVVDSNIIFSAMLNPESSIGDIILNSQDTFTFYCCEYLREEINDHKDKIIKIAGYGEHEYDELEFLVYKQVDFFSESTIPFEFWQKAADFVRDVDMDYISHDVHGQKLVDDSHHKPKFLPFFINVFSNRPSRFLYEPLST